MENGSTHIGLSEFIADLKATNWIKDNPHLLDENSVARWVYLELKGFGRNVMDQYEEVVHINNYRGEMPSNFSNLNLAVYCEVDYVAVPKGSDLIRVQTRLIGEKITTPEVVVCDSCAPIEDSNRCPERVVENLYVEGTQTNIHYKNFNYVKIGPDLIRNHCSPDCFNRGIKSSPYEINIKGTTIYATGFKQGSLYTRYYGTPMDEDGLPVIPITPNRFLEKYLEVYVKRRILEDAMLSKDATNLQFMYGAFLQQELDLYNKAKNDTSKIDMVALYKAVGHNRKRMNKYYINLGTIKSNAQNSYQGYLGAAFNPNSF